MQAHPESVRTPPVQPTPLRHPFYETARQKQAAAFREELAAFVRLADSQRARLAAARILESRPC